jgi:hypothetical protein
MFLVQSSVSFSNAQIGKNYVENQYKNFYVILSTLNLDTVTFIDDTSLYTSAQIALVQGGFIYIAESTLTATDCTFNSGIANQGGVIYSVRSTLTLTGSTFTSNTALQNGGVIFGLLNFNINIGSSTFTDNSAVTGDVLNLERSLSPISIMNTVFSSSSSPSFVHIISSETTIDGCTFTQTANNVVGSLTESVLSNLRFASAIALEGEPTLTVSNSNFMNMLFDYGVILIREIARSSTQSSIKYTFDSNTFDNNTAYGADGGSGIYLINPINANISSNIFSNNNAMNGDGGGVKIECANLFCASKVEGNTFTSNNAGSKGGAISWNKVEPTNVVTNTFTSNTAAAYGDDIGSIGETIEKITEAVYNANIDTSGDVSRNLQALDITDHQSGQVIDTLYIAIKDKYGNIVKYGNTNNINVDADSAAGSSFTASVTGTTSYQPTNGVAKISNLIFSSSPNTTQTLTISSGDLLSSSSVLSLTVGVRSCIEGEELTGSGA